MVGKTGTAERKEERVFDYEETPTGATKEKEKNSTGRQGRREKKDGQGGLKWRSGERGNHLRFGGYP